MKPICKIFLSFAFICLFTNLSIASDSTAFRRTDMYVQVGAGEYFSVSLNADHYFLHYNKIHLGITSGICKYETFSGLGGYQLPLGATFLLGKNHHFIELQSGVLFRSEELKGSGTNYDNSLLGFAALGYEFRYKHFLFKTNIATTLTAQVGFGYIF